MKFALRYGNTGRYADPAAAVELLQAGEEAGFESVWAVEHAIVPKGYESAYPYSPDGKMAGGVSDIPLPDPLIWLAYAAAATSKMKLGTAILILPQHNPVTAAKQVATLDHMSGGRVLLGIGVGWLREEFETLGASFGDRAARADEYIAAMRALWGDGAASFDGEFVRFRDVYCRPRPAHGTVPIIVGGHSKAAARRAGRLGDGFFPARGAPVELFDLARRTAEEHGRDPDALEISVSFPENLQDLPKLARAGVSRVLLPATTMAGLPTAISGPEDALSWKDRIADMSDL